MKKVVFVVGATASGKSAFAHSLIDNHFQNSSILSMDSMQIYKHMNIGSAKPSKEEIKKYRYSMIDFQDPTENFTAKNYVELSASHIENSRAPLFIVGGTGLYMNALKHGIFDEKVDCNDKSIRYKLNALLEENGINSLYNTLKNIDIETANTIDRHNPRRVIRALEVYYKTGKKFSDIKKLIKPRVDISYISFFINLERNTLYNNIDNRVDKMFDDGLMGEVKHLATLGVNETMTSMQAIGYREIMEYINYNGMSKQELNEKIKLNTRHYAKRQVTWFKKEDCIEINQLDDKSYNKALLNINSFLSTNI